MAGFMKGLIFGGLIGGIGTLLTTPKSGKENRKDLEQYIETVTSDVEQVQDHFEVLQQRIQSLKQQLPQQLKETTQEIDHRISIFNDETKPRVKRALSTWNQIQTVLKKSEENE